MRVTQIAKNTTGEGRREAMVQGEVAEMVDAVKFAEAHHLQIVITKLQPDRGVPFYWRFVPADHMAQHGQVAHSA